MQDRLVTHAIAAFQAAALDDRAWGGAVERLARATGSRSGELIGLGPDCRVPFNIMTGADPVAGQEFLAADGGNPLVNSRVRIGSRAAELELKDEADFTTQDDMRGHDAYGDWVTSHDMTHVCLTSLVKQDGLLVGLAVMRGRRDQPIDRQAKRAFATIAPHARRAVRTSIALEKARITGLVTGLEAVRAAAFACTAQGRVKAMTPAAERMVSQGDILSLRRGRIAATSPVSALALQHLIAVTAAGGAGPMAPIALRSRCGEDVRLAEASIIPSAHPLAAGPAVLLIVHDRPADVLRIQAAGQLCHGLSLAEAQIAAQLALGHTVAGVAAARQVSIGTVRSQLRSIFSKLGVASQTELAARLAPYG